MKVPGLRSGKERVGGLAFFGRTLDKVRLNDAGKLPPGYNLGTGFDAWLCEYLEVRYEDLKVRALEGGKDEDLLAWCFERGRRLSGRDVEVWNDYVLKRGWRDSSSERLAQTVAAAGMGGRKDILTWVDFHDADEGRM